jgi:undecaprenyl-diphosphatase
LSPFEAVILGVLQGITEFLPISSSGNLVLGEFLLQVRFDDISFEVFVHLGTFLSVVIVFRRTIYFIFQAIWSKAKFVSSARNAPMNDPYWRLFWLIAVGSIPAGMAGVLFRSYIEPCFSSVGFVSLMLLLTGLTLLTTRFFKGKREKITFNDALVVGVAQALAMFPGISRSGLTISTGIFKGLERSQAAEFSFLLSLPAILGASLLQLGEVLGSSQSGHEYLSYFLGMTSAFGVGYLAIKFLLNVIKKGKFQYFAYYCFVLGFSFLILTG